MISEALKPLQLIGQAAKFKFESKFEPMQVIWQSLLGCSRRSSKVYRAKSTAKLLGQLSCTACVSRTDEHKHKAFSSLLQSLLAATGLLEDNMLTLLTWPWLFVSCEMKISMELARSCCWPSSAPRFAQSFYQSLVSEWKYDIGTKQHVPNRILCKAAGLNQRPVLGKGVCSDSTLKLGNDVRRDSESIATKFCSQIGRK